MVIDTVENEITISRASKAGTLLCARKQHKKKKRTSFRSNYGKGITFLKYSLHWVDLFKNTFQFQMKTKRY